LDKARSLLKSANLRDGFTFTLAYDLSIADHEQVAIILKNSFDKIGARTLLSKLTSAQVADISNQHTFESTLVTGGPLIPDAFYELRLWYHSKSFIDWEGYDNPEIDRLIDDGQVETNLAKRKQMSIDAQRILSVDQPLPGVCQPKHVYTFRRSLKGFAWYTHDMYVWRDLSKS
jgi:ABC-type transport system substrate-binding protein